MRRISTLAVLAVGAALSGPAGAQPGDQPILPGYWESTNTLRALLVINQTKVEQKCLRPQDVGKFMAGPSNRHYKCDYPERTFRDGKVAMKGQCVDKRGRKIDVEVTGDYTPTSFRMQAELDAKLAGLPVSGVAVAEARRLSDTCPPGAATF